jgi:hypothetical protein
MWSCKNVHCNCCSKSRKSCNSVCETWQNTVFNWHFFRFLWSLTIRWTSCWLLLLYWRERKKEAGQPTDNLHQSCRDSSACCEKAQALQETDLCCWSWASTIERSVSSNPPVWRNVEFVLCCGTLLFSFTISSLLTFSRMNSHFWNVKLSLCLCLRKRREQWENELAQN